MIKQIHLAAQYLAAAGISFKEKQDDDSHTNMGWSIDKKELSSWPLSKQGDQLSLNLKTFSLIWSNGENQSSFSIQAKTHREILEWVKRQAESNLKENYIYDFHYELPYPFPDDDFEYTLIKERNLLQFSNLLDLAQTSFTKVLKQQELSSKLRVWPHHFDLGAFCSVNKSLSIGFGLAIPDSSIDDYYLYVSGYRGEETIETKNFKPLKVGTWQTGDWKAATLKGSALNENNAVPFLTEAINAYRSSELS